MIVSREVFASVVRYLSQFGRAESPVLFTPIVNGDQVLASIDCNGVYAQYSFAPSQPLKERFACRYSVLHSIADVADDDDIFYRKASTALFSCGDAEYRVPYVSINTIHERPDFITEQNFRWDGSSFVQLLTLMSESVAEEDRDGCLDCVKFELRSSGIGFQMDNAKGELREYQRQGSRIVVASDRKIMTVWHESDVKCDYDASLLIDRRNIPQILATCESQQPVDVRIGVSQFTVQCGRRLAVFGLRSGVYPKGWLAAWKSTKDTPIAGTVSIDRHQLGVAVKQTVAGLTKDDSKAVTLATSYGRMMMSAASDDDRGVSDVAVPSAKVNGRFGPVGIHAAYLELISKHWPDREVSLSSQSGKGSNRPVQVASETKQLTAIVVPMEIDLGHATTMFEHITVYGSDETYEPNKAAKATKHLPGDWNRVEVMRKRLESAQDLWHKDDPVIEIEATELDKMVGRGRVSE